MNVFALSLTIVLAIAFAGAGILKLAVPKGVLHGRGLTWVEKTSPGLVKAIGFLELLGALGLVLPWWLGKDPYLTPAAATALCIVMVCALVVHLRRHEMNRLPPPAILGVLCAVLADIRFVQL